MQDVSSVTSCLLECVCPTAWVFPPTGQVGRVGEEGSQTTESMNHQKSMRRQWDVLEVRNILLQEDDKGNPLRDRDMNLASFAI